MHRLYLKIFLFFILLSNPCAGFAQSGITGVTVTPQNNTAGATTLYTITFTNTPDIQGLPKGGRIQIIFPATFDLSNVISASSGSTEMTGGFSSIDVDDVIGADSDTVTCLRDGTGNDVPANQANVTLRLAVVGNPSSPTTDISLELRTLTQAGVLIDDGASAPFDVSGVINSLTLSNPSAQTAGQAFTLSVLSARDVNLNPASGIVHIYASQGGGPAPDGTEPIFNDIVVANGVGSAPQTLYKAQGNNVWDMVQVKLLGTSGAASDETSPITVNNAGIRKIDVSGEPGSSQANATFVNQIAVKAWDAYENYVTGYAGTVHFTSTDPLVQVPADYAFTSGVLGLDNGVHSFPGSNFILRTIGNQTISVTDGTRSTTTQTILVTKGAINDFTVSVGSSPRVNQPLSVTITNARDAAGNLTDGTVTLSFNDGQSHAAPDGTLPVLGSITVVNGTGSTNISLYKAEASLVLKGTSGSVNVLSSAFAVAPGSVYEFDLTGYPTSVLAGNNFGAKTVRVVARDAFANRKTDYSGSVWFESATDPAAAFTYFNLANSYTFIVADSGAHEFPGSNFQFTTIGQRNFAVTNGTISRTSGNIAVQAGNITSFAVSARTTTPAAGDTFTVFITNARDASNNLTSGLIAISFNDGGGHLAPDGYSQPILNHIEVVNGYGKAKQVLYRSESNVVLRAQSGAAVNTTTITISPGALSGINLTTPPDTVTAGFPLSQNITVTMMDTWKNVKTNFTGPLYFTSSDAQAQLTFNSANSYQFVSGDNGVHTFSGSAFSLRTAGVQTITAVSGSVNQVSSTIQVKGAAIAAFQLTVGATQTAGVQFPLQVTTAVDGYNNPTSGTVVVTAISGGNPAPNGVLPTLTNIPVFNGSGTAYQTLVKSESVTLRGTAAGVFRNTSAITVQASSLAQLDVTGYPSTVVSGVAFSSPVVITAKDGFGNEKSNYSGTLRFSSTDANASLPPDTLISGRSQISYSGSRFILSSGGQQTITVTGVGSGISKTSNGINVNAVSIYRISSSSVNVSRGQNSVPVMMEVRNIGPTAVTNLQAQLHFRRNGQSRDSKFMVTRTDLISAIADSGSATLLFDVDVHADADSGTISLTGDVLATVSGQVVSDTTADIPCSWWVQKKAKLTITNITPPAYVDQGRSGLIVSTVANNYPSAPLGAADAIITKNELRFTKIDGSDVSGSFVVTDASANPTTVAGESQAILSFTVSADNNAPAETIRFRHYITYRDSNIGIDTTIVSQAIYSFDCHEHPALVITEITPSQTNVTAGQDWQWTVRMRLNNAGGAPLTLSFDQAKSFIKFRYGSNDYTSSYTILQPTSFDGGGTVINAAETKDLTFTIQHVGNAIGSINIWGRVEATDGTFTNSDVSNVQSGVVVQTTDDLRILKVLPSQATATKDDATYPWTVAVVLSNYGGSEVQIDFAQSVLSFSSSAGFDVLNPTQLENLGTSLKAGQSDTMVFSIRQTGSIVGQNTIGASVFFQVLNTHQSKNITAGTSARGKVTIQNPSNFHITGVRPSRSSVTAGVAPTWSVAVKVSNEGGGADVEVNLASANTWTRIYRSGVPQMDYTFLAPTGLAGTGEKILAAGAKDSLIYAVTAMGTAMGALDIYANVSVIESNRQLAVEKLSDPPGTINVQTRASVTYASSSVQPTNVYPQQFVAFQIGVSNGGQSTLELNSEQTKFEFSDGSRTFSSTLDPSFTSTVPGMGGATLYFRAEDVPGNFAHGNFAPTVTLSGKENGNPYSTQLTLTGNPITVGPPGELAISFLDPDVDAVTAGQTREWHINMGLTNNGTGSLHLDSAKVTFSYNSSDVSNKFHFIIPDTLVSGSRYLHSQSSDSLRISVQSIEETVPTGPVAISAKIFTTDSSQTTLHPSGQVTGNIQVQSRGNLSITKVHPSQLTITRGQDSPWQMAVQVRNSGGSTLRLSADAGQTFLDFYTKGNENFTVQSPVKLVGSGNLDLAPSASDSLFFTIQNVSTAVTAGQCPVRVTVGATEVNSGRLLSAGSSQSTVTIQNPAQVRIDSLRVEVPLDSTVNTNQLFYIKAKVTNVVSAGQEEQVQSATVRIESTQHLSTFPSGSTASVDTINAGQSKWMRQGVLVQSPANSVREDFHARVVDSRSKNTGKPVTVLPSVNPKDSTVTVQVQRPGDLAITKIYAEPDSVPAGYSSEWKIFVVITNTGEGNLFLSRPQSSNISVDKSGYGFRAPVLAGENLLLRQGEIDTLEYTVTSTGSVGGSATFTVRIGAKDGNDSSLPEIAETGTIIVPITPPTSAVRITKTYVSTGPYNVDANGVAHLNTSQEFRVCFEIKNEGVQDLQTVRLKLNPRSSQVLDGSELIMSNIEIGRFKSDSFRVAASTSENLVGENIYVQILEATGRDGSNAKRYRATDSTVAVKIYKPANLKIVGTRNLTVNPDKHVSFGQKFDIAVDVANIGSEEAGNVRVNLDATPDALGNIENTLLTIPGTISRSDTETVVFKVTAGSSAATVGFKSAIEQAIGLNSKAAATVAAAGGLDSTYAVLEAGASLKIVDVTVSVADKEINAGSRDAWYVDAIVANQGGAKLEFKDIATTNVTFKSLASGTVDDGYRLRKPDALEASGNMILEGGVTDTLRYVVTQTGEMAGQMLIQVSLNAFDRNKGSVDGGLSASGADTVSVTSTAFVLIKETSISSLAHDKDGAGLVNRDQSFVLNVILGTGQVAGVDEVKLQLKSDGNTIPDSEPMLLTIDHIARDSIYTAVFQLTADASWNALLGERRETFAAEILSAKAVGSELSAQIRTPNDSSAVLRIQNPADLEFSLLMESASDTVLATGQEFAVLARVKNKGTAQVNNGRVSLTPPSGYEINAGDDVWVPNAVELDFALDDKETYRDIRYLLKAPGTESTGDIIRGFISQLPNDSNSGQAATLSLDKDSLTVTTLSSQVSVLSLTIANPLGARDSVLSTDQNFVLRSQIRATQNLKNRRTWLELPILPGDAAYEFRTPQEVLIKNAADTVVEWTLRAPAIAAPDPHSFIVHAEGVSEEEGSKTNTRAIEIKRVVNRTNLYLQNLVVSAPEGVMQDGKAYFSQGQSATLSTRITNSGNAGVTIPGRIRIEFLQSGLTLERGTAEQDFEIDQDVTWQVKAPASSVTEHPIRVTIVQAPTDENSNGSAQVSVSSQELTVSTQAAGSISIPSISISNPAGARDSTLSAEQSFDVSIGLSYSRIQPGAVATIHFSSEAFIVTAPSITLTSGQKSVEWKNIKAPSIPKAAPDTMWATVTAQDQSSGAMISAISQKKRILTQARTTFSLIPQISQPEGLNYRVSSDQAFDLSATIHQEGAPFVASDSFVVQLVQAASFTLLNEAIQTVKGISEQPVWHLQAPDVGSLDLSKFIFKFLTVPRDANSEQVATVTNSEFDLYLQTVERARIRLGAFLDEANQVTNGSVRISSSFQVAAGLANLGEAGLEGNYRVEMTLPSTQYATDDSLTKTGGDGSIYWTIRAPSEFTPNRKDTILFTLKKAPTDQYSKSTAAILDSVARIVVSTEAGMLIARTYNVRSGSVVPSGGFDIPLLGVELRNKDLASGTESVLTGLKLSLRSKKGNAIPANSVLTRLAAVRHSDYQHIYAEISELSSSSQLFLDFTSLGQNTLSIVGSQPDSFDIIVDITGSQKYPEFIVAIDSSASFIASDANSGQPLVVSDSTGVHYGALNLVSKSSVLIAENLESFCNFPNPFGIASDPERRETKFLYYLKQASNIDVKIFTLTGDLVRAWTFTKASHPAQTSQGIHEGSLKWDGTNGRGVQVMNGVYLAYITTEYGETAVTKIAVVR